MNVVELKGHLLTLIAQLEDERSLSEILRFSIGIAEKEDALEDMPAEAIADLEKAIQESYQDENGTSHEEVIKMAEAWLKK